MLEDVKAGRGATKRTRRGNSPVRDNDHMIMNKADAGSILYIDGRFYTCVDRLPMGIARIDDTLELIRIPLGDCPEALARCGENPIPWPIADLDELEAIGLAALVGREPPSRPAVETAMSPKGPRGFTGTAAIVA